MILSIIIPCFNEENTVSEALKKVETLQLDNLGIQKEFIAVDDGSSDRTWDILSGLQKEYRIKLIRHEKNMGKGFAIRSGLAVAMGDIVIIQDADLEYSPLDYPTILKPFIEKKAEVVYGSRFLKNKYPANMKLAYYFANKLLTSLANVLYNIRITDEATCYKAFKKDVLEKLNLECRGFEFCPEVTAKLSLKKIEIVEVPIQYQARRVEEGKKISLKDGFKAILTLLKYRFRKF